jgi:predicted glycoside hydrolase/deacetylase ChbG (UPF0249 family)
MIRPATPAGLRPWVVAADDFGLHEAANGAILDLLARGTLSATSVLTDAPGWPEAAPELMRLRRGGGAVTGTAGSAAGTASAMGPDIGLHLNLTETLGGAAAAGTLPAVLLRSQLGQLPPAFVAAAIERQLDAFEAWANQPPDYVDGHQHVHQLAGVRAPLLQALRRRYGTHPIWLRSTRPGPGGWQGKARFIAALGDRPLRRLAGASGFAMSPCLLGVYDFTGDATQYRARLAAWAATGPAGAVLMCHPARAANAAAGMPASDPIATARGHEYAVLRELDWSALGVVPRPGRQIGFSE